MSQIPKKLASSDCEPKSNVKSKTNLDKEFAYLPTRISVNVKNINSIKHKLNKAFAYLPLN